MRAALANASILVTSPMDRGQKNGGEIVTLPTTPRIVDIQRRAAIVLLCLCAGLAFGAQADAQTNTTTKASAKKKPVKKAKKPARRKVREPSVHHYAAPRVSEKMRALSLQKVALQLDERPDPVIDRPGNLVPFFERLYRLSTRDSPTMHILHFGDSHTASDDWTGVLRDLFQGRFGNGGAGFSLAGIPFKGYRRFDVRGGASKAWDPAGLRTGEGDGLFGLGGVSISTERAAQTIYLDADCASVELDYLQQPGGGRLALSDNGATVAESSTEGPLAPGFLEYASAPGRHRFEVRTLEAAPVRLFGWVTENPKGITYESMGINGAEAALIQRWDETMHAAYLKRRDPALIVLAYGTNEASDSKWTEAGYLEAFSAVLQRLRRAVPAASILVLGPPDRFLRVKGRWRPFDGVDRIVAAQQEACRQNRCAYWNTRARMGAEGSMVNWVMAGLAQGNYAHFTSQGY
ncbi:MAG TPA: GDSL-type esterase/lipase family protein, partial [Bryobacteraceae bacterium]|nr:GDSL-type esterase/lipase family protein [Bryobacteraceae bacterium]